MTDLVLVEQSGGGRDAHAQRIASERARFGEGVEALAVKRPPRFTGA